MTHPKITNSLKGALGETYYKELCSQRGWAYCSLEVIYSCKDLDTVTFKMGFERIRVNIPRSIRSEVLRIAKPSNKSPSHNPSFVFDYLSCKIGQEDTSQIQHPQASDFCWAEIKTGWEFSQTISIKHCQRYVCLLQSFIEDVLVEPKYIEMDWEMTSGTKFASTLVDDDDDYYDYKDHPRNTWNNSKYDNYNSSRGNNYQNSNSSRRSGMVAKFSSTCNVCRRKITAGKDRITQDRYSNWIHVICASQRKH